MLNIFVRAKTRLLGTPLPLNFDLVKHIAYDMDATILHFHVNCDNLLINYEKRFKDESRYCVQRDFFQNFLLLQGIL